MTRLHIVGKRVKTGKRWYVYAWRGGPCIAQFDGARPTIGPELLGLAADARRMPQEGAQDVAWLCRAYRAAPEFMGLSASTKRDYRLWLDRIEERFGDAALGVFEDRRMRAVIMAWRDTWVHQPRSADKATVMLATLLGWALERGLLAINVAAGIKHLHSANKAEQVWEERHWLALAAAPAHLLDALKLASLTGLRLGDLIRLDWSAVGEKAIIVTTRKRKARAVIPILPELRAHLDAREHRTGAVLRNSRGKAWTESGMGSVFQKAKPADFDRTMHDLRGTFATWLAVKGLTDEQIARIIGWSAKQVGEIRARYVDEARVVISMVERLSA